jgi:hypothetical protein
MKEVEKCAHPACKCLVPSNSPHGKYCSVHCQNAPETSDVKCGCGHPGCA